MPASIGKIKKISYFVPQNRYKKEIFKENQAEIRAFVNQVKNLSENIPKDECKKALNPAIQRTLDLIIAGVLAVPSSIVLGTAVLLKKLSEPKKPVFNKQKRFGKNCNTFNIYKIQTVEKTPDGWRKSSDYERLLRRLSIDEIPQIWNIIKGNMSFAGPRPLLYKDLKQLADKKGMEFIARRNSLKSGFGFGYNSGRKSRKPVEELEADFYKNHGIKAYFGIIKSLASTILKGNNA